MSRVPTGSIWKQIPKPIARDTIVFNLLAPVFYVAARHLKIVVFPAQAENPVHMLNWAIRSVKFFRRRV